MQGNLNAAGGVFTRPAFGPDIAAMCLDDLREMARPNLKVCSPAVPERLASVNMSNYFIFHGNPDCPLYVLIDTIIILADTRFLFMFGVIICIFTPDPQTTIN
ncbi:MAG: hypothetical protein ACTHNW_12060 [Mucilaginibacter sp.]